MRIGVPKEYLDLAESLGSGGGRGHGGHGCNGSWSRNGAIVEVFELGMVDYAIPAYYVIASAEASSNLARFDGVKYGYRAKEYDGLHNMYKKST